MTQTHALVIDDNAQNVKVLVQLLTKQSVTTTQVTNPSDIPNVISGLDQLDVIFLDLEMPGSDGFSVRDTLKRKFPDVPIVAYTVHISEINAVRLAGFDGFLGKPLDNTRFPDQLARILRREPVWDRG
jgi:two-component system, cell cycle response regulator DivK